MLTENENNIINDITYLFRQNTKGLIKYIDNVAKNTKDEIDDEYDMLKSLSVNKYFIKYSTNNYVYILKHSIIYEFLYNYSDEWNILNFKESVKKYFDFILYSNNNYSFFPKFIKSTENYLVFEKIKVDNNIEPNIDDLFSIALEFRKNNPFSQKKCISPFYHHVNFKDYVFDINKNVNFVDIKKIEEHDNLGFMLYDRILNTLYIYDKADDFDISNFYKYGCYDSNESTIKNINVVDLTEKFRLQYFEYKLRNI